MILLELFWTFFKIGAFTFGGGYAMLPLVQDAVVAHGWMELSQIIDFIAVSESTPGPFAVNIATYVGSEVGGLAGSVCATLGIVSPSFIIILAVAKFFDSFRKSAVVEGVMTGLKPAVVGLIGSAVITMAAAVFFADGLSTSVLLSADFYALLAIFVLCLVLAFKKVPPVVVIIISALLGIGVGYLLM